MLHTPYTRNHKLQVESMSGKFWNHTHLWCKAEQGSIDWKETKNIIIVNLRGNDIDFYDNFGWSSFEVELYTKISIVWKIKNSYKDTDKNFEKVPLTIFSKFAITKPENSNWESWVDSYVDIAYGFAVRFKFSFHLTAIIERPKSPLKKIVRIKNYGINIKWVSIYFFLTIISRQKP